MMLMDPNVRHRGPESRLAPAILLRETYRDDGKVKNRILANLTTWKPEKVPAGLRARLLSLRR